MSNNLKSIPREGSFGQVASVIDQNNLSLEARLTKVESATIKNYGLFSTLEKLETDYPTASSGSTAYVGPENNAERYDWLNDAWTPSGEYMQAPTIDLNDYQTKTEAEIAASEKLDKSSVVQTLTDSTETTPSSKVVKTEIDKLSTQINEQKSGIDTAVDEGIKKINNLSNQTNITAEQLDPSVFESLGSNNTNIADGEDLVEEKTSETTGVLKLKDRVYVPNSMKGKGAKILRMNVVEGVNVLTQEMVNEENTVYDIRYDYDLNGETINIPQGCVLNFIGGSLSNGVIVGDYSGIESSPVKIFSNIQFEGSWSVIAAYAEWFGAIGNRENDDTVFVQKALDEFDTVQLCSKQYRITASINMNMDNTLKGENDTYILSDGTFDVINIGFRNVVKSLKFVVDEPCTIFKITSEYMGVSFVENPDLIHSIPDMQLQTTAFTKISDILAYTEYEGEPKGIFYHSIANGIGEGFWQVKMENVGVNGLWDTGIKLDNSTIASAKANTWQTDSEFVSIKFFGTVNGIIITKNDEVGAPTGGFPPERITFERCSMQGRTYSKHFATIDAGNRIVFNSCEPWDWNVTDGYKPYKINPNRTKGCSIVNSGNTADLIVELSEEVDSNGYYGAGYTILPNINANSLAPYAMGFFVDIDMDRSLTIQELKNLPAGSYLVGNDYKWIKILNVPSLLNLISSNIGILEKSFTHNGDFVLKLYVANSEDRTNAIGICVINTNTTTEIIWNAYVSGNKLFATEADMLSDRQYVYGYTALVGNSANSMVCQKRNDTYLLDALGYPLNERKGWTQLPTNLRDNFDRGYTYYSYDAKKPLYFNGADDWRDASGSKYNATFAGGPLSRPVAEDISRNFQYWDSSLNAPIFWDGTVWRFYDGTPIDVLKKGTTEQRPTTLNATTDIGFVFFDTTLIKPVYWTGSKWVDATGTDV